MGEKLFNAEKFQHAVFSESVWTPKSKIPGSVPEMFSLSYLYKLLSVYNKNIKIV